MKAGQLADSNFQNFNDIDTAGHGTVAVKKKKKKIYSTSYHPDLYSMMAKMPSNTAGFGFIKYISVEDRLKKSSPFPSPAPS